MKDDGRDKKVFVRYLRTGADAELEERADKDGGYAVPVSMAERIKQVVAESSPMRRLASVATVSADASAVSAPLLVKRIIPTHELYAQPKATQKLVDDSTLDIDEWLASKVADIFARKESDAFINGTGVGMPHGILYHAQRGMIEVRRSGANAEATAHGIISLYHSLSGEFAKRAWFIMNRDAVQAVRLLQDPATQSYLWQPGLSAGAPDTLVGVPVQVVHDMPAASCDALAVAIGDFGAAYQIVDRAGLRILRDPFTERPFVKFYTTKRVGGDVINPDAIKVLALAA